VSARDESLSQVYASALVDLAFEKGVHAEVLAELKGFDQVLEQDPQFADFLYAPNIRQDVKKDVLDKAFGPSFSDVTLNFLRVVIDKRRQAHLPQIVTDYTKGYHERMGELVVTVFSAAEMSGGQRDRLSASLKKTYNMDVILEEQVKPDLLGGLVIKVADQRIDGSLRTRLETIGSRLHRIRLHSEDHYED
jgi:F-type H+-transporting ATPase subunit delta